MSLRNNVYDFSTNYHFQYAFTSKTCPLLSSTFMRTIISIISLKEWNCLNHLIFFQNFLCMVSISMIIRIVWHLKINLVPTSNTNLWTSLLCKFKRTIISIIPLKELNCLNHLIFFQNFQRRTIYVDDYPYGMGTCDHL